MQTLGKNWFIENLLDAEYKKYILLAYLQQVQQHFNQQKLYPHLSDLVFHYRNLAAFEEKRLQLYHQFPERIADIDLENFRLAYAKVTGDDELMNEIEVIVHYAMPRLKEALNNGKAIYEFVEAHVDITPIGILPLYRQEGYMFLKETNKDTRVYEYQVTLFEEQSTKYRGIHTRYLSSYKHSISNTFENIKRELVRMRPQLPNPAAYALEIKTQFPLAETLEPIAQRLLVKHISKDL